MVNNLQIVKDHGDMTEVAVTYDTRNCRSSVASSMDSEALSTPTGQHSSTPNGRVPRKYRQRSISRERGNYPVNKQYRKRSQSRPSRSVSSSRRSPSGSCKRELVPQVKQDIIQTFYLRYKGEEGQTDVNKKEGMRGENVVRIKCTTKKHLMNIKNFLVKCEEEIEQVSCPNSQKKNCLYPQGFQCYMKAYDAQCVESIQRKFEEFQEKNDKPFKKLEINPRSQADKERERLSASQEVPTAISTSQRTMLERCDVTLDCESPPEILAPCVPKVATPESTSQDNDCWMENEITDYQWNNEDGYSRQGSFNETETNL